MQLSRTSEVLLLKAGPPALAARKGFSVRTLRRRLADEGTSLRGLTESLRATKGRRLLEDGYRPTRVAEELGFATPRTFWRYCRRVFNLPPSQFQRELRRQAENKALAGAIATAALAASATSAVSGPSADSGEFPRIESAI